MNPVAALGWRPIAAHTSSKRSLASSACRQLSASMPTVSIRVTPASRAAPTSSSSLAFANARWVWESTIGYASCLGNSGGRRTTVRTVPAAGVAPA